MTGNGWVSVVSVLIFGLAAGAASAQDHKWVGLEKCSSCHDEDDIGNQTKVWQGNPHAKARESLATQQAKDWAKEAGVSDPETDAKCVKCHQSAYGVAPELLSKSFDPSLGVQCESCHGAGKDYRKEEYMIDTDVAVERGLIPQSEEVCVACHNDDSPAWDPEAYTRADGTKVGFDYEQAAAAIAHPVPEGYDPTADDDEDDLWGDEEE